MVIIEFIDRLTDTVIHSQDWNDTFLNFEHLRDSFPESSLEWDQAKYSEKELMPPYRLIFPRASALPPPPFKGTPVTQVAPVTKGAAPVKGGASSISDISDTSSSKSSSKPALRVEPYRQPLRSPYPAASEPLKNAIRFTPRQVEGIRSGMQPGLTLIVGPPGTGKTDVAVQIISNLYHNYPDQRTLLVTHSNQVFQRLSCADHSQTFVNTLLSKSKVGP